MWSEDGRDPPLIQEFFVTGGYAYQGVVGKVVEFAPRIALGVRAMNFTGVLRGELSSITELRSTFAVELGLTTRLMLAKHFGFHFDFALVAGPMWELSGPSSNFSLLGQPEGRFSGGLSFRF
jgi:hypothetical protein